MAPATLSAVARAALLAALVVSLASPSPSREVRATTSPSACPGGEGFASAEACIAAISGISRSLNETVVHPDDTCPETLRRYTTQLSQNRTACGHKLDRIYSQTLTFLTHGHGGSHNIRCPEFYEMLRTRVNAVLLEERQLRGRGPSCGTPSTCADAVINGEPWTDADGDTCAVYESGHVCEGGHAHRNIRSSCVGGDCKGRGGLYADQACCACGGGGNISESTPEPTTEPTSEPSEATSGPTSVLTSVPTSKPASEPTLAPTSGATSGPTSGATSGPTSRPTSGPTSGPTASGVKDVDVEVDTVVTFNMHNNAIMTDDAYKVSFVKAFRNTLEKFSRVSGDRIKVEEARARDSPGNTNATVTVHAIIEVQTIEAARSLSSQLQSEPNQVFSNENGYDVQRFGPAVAAKATVMKGGIEQKTQQDGDGDDDGIDHSQDKNEYKVAIGMGVMIAVIAGIIIIALPPALGCCSRPQDMSGAQSAAEQGEGHAEERKSAPMGPEGYLLVQLSGRGGGRGGDAKDDDLDHADHDVSVDSRMLGDEAIDAEEGGGLGRKKVKPSSSKDHAAHKRVRFAEDGEESRLIND